MRVLQLTLHCCVNRDAYLDRSNPVIFDNNTEDLWGLKDEEQDNFEKFKSDRYDTGKFKTDRKKEKKMTLMVYINTMIW